MAEYLARDHKFEVSTDGVAYTTVSGINNWGFTNNGNMQDVTTFDDGGHNRQLKSSLEHVFTMEGLRTLDGLGALDAGQKEVEKSIQQMGTAALRHYRVTYPADGTVQWTLDFRGTANQSQDLGGGNDDFQAWGVEVAVYGAITASGIYN